MKLIDDDSDDNMEFQHDEEEPEEDIVNMDQSDKEDQPKKSVDNNDFAKGAIVRLSVKDFVTYDFATFNPGRHLNMIIGPNGTGKSTLVCAIALGLTGDTKLLGRQKDIKDFIKRGKERAYIEIELKSTPKNTIIRREFNHTSIGSTWKLNGKPSTLQKIKDIVKSFNIQVDNLCQFLPQDKVAEFAKMTPDELLKKTEHAAADPHLLNWHNELINSSSKESSKKNVLENEKKALENLEKKNASILNQVERYREREAIDKKILLYDCAIVGRKFEEAKQPYVQAKRVKEKLLADKKEAEEKCRPLADKRNRLKERDKRLTAESEVLKESYKKVNLNIAKYMEESENLESKIDVLKENVVRADQSKKKILSDLAKKQQEIEKLQRDEQSCIAKLQKEGLFGENGQPLANPVGRYKVIQSTLMDIKESLDKLHDQKRDIIQEMNDINKVTESFERQRSAKERELHALDNVKEQILNSLKRYNNNVYKAYQYIQQNPQVFEKPVLGPVCLEIFPKKVVNGVAVDVKWSSAILESNIGNNGLLTFVCQTDKDYRTFTNIMNREMKLRIDAACLMRNNYTMESFPLLLTPRTTSELGFDGHVLELVDGPEPILHALCSRNNLHKVLYSRKGTTLDHHAIEADPRIGLYYSDLTRYQITRAYGTMATNSYNLNPNSRYLSQSVDVALKQQLKDAIQTIYMQMKEQATVLSQSAAKMKDVDKKIDALKAKEEDENKLKKEINNYKRALESKRARIVTTRGELETYPRPESIDVKKRQYQEEIDRIHETRAGLISDVERENSKAFDILSDYINKILVTTDNYGEIQDVEQENKTLTEFLNNAESRFEAAEKDLVIKKKAVKALQIEATEMFNKLSEEDHEQVQNEYIGKETAELEGLLFQEQAKLELIDAGSAAVVAEFDARAKEIKKLRKVYDEHVKEMDNLSEKINQIKIKWETELQQLIDNISGAFSAAFEGIGCTGEIALAKNEEGYDKWGIDILVKFRDTDTLQLLTSTRQSGGERSVSTILYLMALQSLAKSPFRVVDEINQGMDPRNERLIHGQMVENACEKGNSQYFLITPKLLPDLDYHPKMSVSCIFNGAHQPEVFDMKKGLEKHRAYLEAH